MGAGICGFTAGASVSDITMACVFRDIISLDATLRPVGTTEPDCCVLLGTATLSVPTGVLCSAEAALCFTGFLLPQAVLMAMSTPVPEISWDSLQ